MLANAARQDLRPLIRATCLDLLQAAQHSFPWQFDQALNNFPWQDLLGVCHEPVLPGPEEQAERLRRVVLAAQELEKRLLALLDNARPGQHPRLRTLLTALRKIIADEVRVEDGKVSRLPAKEQGSFRIGSATDLEATYRVHGPEPEDTSFGYNIQVAISKNGLIQETQAYTGATLDQAGVAALIRTQQTRRAVCPEKLIYDQAAGTGKIRAEVKAASDGHTQLISKLPDYEKRSERFGPYDFQLSPDGKTLTCPQGKSSTAAYPSGSSDGRDFRFFDYQCWQGELPNGKRAPDPASAQRCPLWEKCRDARQGPRSMRQVFISNYREQVQSAQEYNATEQFAYEMKLRPRVERVIFELTHYYGARQCRRRGLANADWQAKMCSVAYNLKHWIRLLDRTQLGARA